MIFAYYIFMFSEVKLLFEPVLPSVASVGQLASWSVGWLVGWSVMSCPKGREVLLLMLLWNNCLFSFFVRIAYTVSNASLENKAQRHDMVAWLAGNRM